jgi:hypothetical protein
MKSRNYTTATVRKASAGSSTLHVGSSCCKIVTKTTASTERMKRLIGA